MGWICIVKNENAVPQQMLLSCMKSSVALQEQLVSIVCFQIHGIGKNAGDWKWKLLLANNILVEAQGYCCSSELLYFVVKNREKGIMGRVE